MNDCDTAVPKAYDNWTNRGTFMRCHTCMWFVQKHTEAIQRVDHLIGRCRRNAPTMSGWPVIYSDDWCGQHKINEARV